MHKVITILRINTKRSYIPVIKAVMSNNTQTWPCVLGELWGTESRELCVIYVIEFILLSHLQLISPMYELFLEITKAHGTMYEVSGSDTNWQGSDKE